MHAFLCRVVTMEQRAGARRKRTPVWRAFSTSLVKIGLSADVGFVIVSQAAALASGPVFWEISRQEDVVKGDARGITIADNGAISLAPALELVFDTKEAYIWSSAVDAQGNVYLGT